MSTRFLIAILSLILLGGVLILIFESNADGVSTSANMDISVNEAAESVSVSR